MAEQHAPPHRRRAASDLVNHLGQCHARIRTLLDLALDVAGRSDVCGSEVANTCARIELYFVAVMPLHVRDEEESILPRLLRASPALEAAIHRMEQQHDLHEALIHRLASALRALRLAPDAPGPRHALVAVARPLRTLLEVHLRAEEDVMFTAIPRLLSVCDQSDVLAELRARRRDAVWLGPEPSVTVRSARDRD